MTNLARFRINGTASTPSGFDATHGQALTFALEAPSSLVQRWTLEVYSAADENSPRASKLAPALTLVGATSGQKVDAANPAANITSAAAGSGYHSWIVRSTVNGGVNAKGLPDPDLVFERIVSIRTPGGRRKIIASEGTQYAAGGWADAQNDDVDAEPGVAPNPPYIDPALLGAVGNGVTDDMTALTNAITAGVLANKPVDGLGRTYAVAGNITLPSGAWLQNIRLVQLTPGGGTRRTLVSNGADNILLANVVVDRNGDGTNGVHQVDAGIYLEDGSGHHLEGVEVFGDDIGVGIVFRGITDSDIVRAHVHDISYSLGLDPGNDRVQGIWLTDCDRVKLLDCRAHDIGGDYGAGYTLRWSRGFTFARCENLEVHRCYAWMVDQGYDATGGVPGNRRFLFADSFAIDCLTWGFKFANTAYEGHVDSCVAVRCGLSGFVANGPTGPDLTAYATRDIIFSNCDSYDVGAPGLPGGPVAGERIGFRAMNGTFDVDSTVGIKWRNCRAIDTQDTRTMSHGFDNEIAAPVTGNYNECDAHCIVIGALGVPFRGLNVPRCEVSRSTVQAIPSGSWEAVEWNADVDLGNMHSTSSASHSVTARRAGRYRSTWGVVFAANATGQRGVRILREGAVIPGTTQLVSAAASGETALQVSWSSEMGAGDNLRIEVFQSSGSALNLQTSSGGVVEQQ